MYCLYSAIRSRHQTAEHSKERPMGQSKRTLSTIEIIALLQKHGECHVRKDEKEEKCSASDKAGGVIRPHMATHGYEAH